MGSGVVRGRHTLPSGGPWGPNLCPEAWVGADARVSPLPCPPGASLGWGLLVSGASARLGVEGEGPDSVARTPLLSFQPVAQGAFLRGSGLSLASGRFTAPVTAIFQFFASLHVGERGRARVHVGRGGWPSGCAPGLGPIAEASPARTLTPLGAGRVLTPTLPNPQCAPKPPSPCPPAPSSLKVLQTWPVSADPRELQGRARLRARDTVRVLVCIESLCHRHT